MNDNLIIIDNVYYCPYCGEIIKPDEYGQFICHCNDATTARKIEREAMQLEWNAQILRNSKPKPHYHTQFVCAPISDTQEPLNYKAHSKNDFFDTNENSHEKYPEE